jgi:hypothetical protein
MRIEAGELFRAGFAASETLWVRPAGWFGARRF